MGFHEIRHPSRNQVTSKKDIKELFEDKHGEVVGTLWDLLHEVSQFIPVGEKELYTKVQTALDNGAYRNYEFGTCCTFYKVEYWDNVQRRFQVLKRKCTKKEAQQLRDDYKKSGKKTQVIEVTQYETEVSQ